METCIFHFEPRIQVRLDIMSLDKLCQQRAQHVQIIDQLTTLGHFGSAVDLLAHEIMFEEGLASMVETQERARMAII